MCVCVYAQSAKKSYFIVLNHIMFKCFMFQQSAKKKFTSEKKSVKLQFMNQSIKFVCVHILMFFFLRCLHRFQPKIKVRFFVFFIWKKQKKTKKLAMKDKFQI